MELSGRQVRQVRCIESMPLDELYKFFDLAVLFEVSAPRYIVRWVGDRIRREGDPRGILRDEE